MNVQATRICNQTWVIAQAIRNELEMFHGGGALDPGNPDAERGFISDAQMRALNIVIRHTVHKALSELDTFTRHGADGKPALDYCDFQMASVSDYMELPGSAELERAYKEIAGEPA